MPRRIDPVDVVVQFFESAPLEQAQTVLVIARGILARRQPKVKRSPSGFATSPEAAKQEAAKPARKATQLRASVPATLASEWGGENDRAEIVPAHVKTTKGGIAVEEDGQP